MLPVIPTLTPPPPIAESLGKLPPADALLASGALCSYLRFVHLHARGESAFAQSIQDELLELMGTHWNLVGAQIVNR